MGTMGFLVVYQSRPSQGGLWQAQVEWHSTLHSAKKAMEHLIRCKDGPINYRGIRVCDVLLEELFEN